MNEVKSAGFDHNINVEPNDSWHAQASNINVKAYSCLKQRAVETVENKSDDDLAWP